MKLELREVRKSYGAQAVLEGLSLSLDAVRSLVLIGPSGCGKSTLLRLLGGLESPQAGSLEVNGIKLDSGEAARRAWRRSVGTVFQAYNLFPHLTALANITLPLEKVHGLPAAEARERALAQLTRFRLEAHAAKMPAELSGGQRQRVAIARALSIQPRLLLFDEPTSALDPEMTAEVLEVIAELRGEGRDLILVTHHMAFAREVADHVVFLAEGKVKESVPGGEIFEHPRQPQTQEFLSRILRY